MKKGKLHTKSGGFVSVAAVVAMSLLITALLIAGFKRALVSQGIEKKVQLQIDYGQKEDALVRGIVGQVPDALAGMMQIDSADNSADYRWSEIFAQAGQIANVSDSDEGILASIGESSAINVNVGDDTGLVDYSAVIRGVGADTNDTSSGTRVGDMGVLASYASKLPPPLTAPVGYTQSKADNYPDLVPGSYYDSADWSGTVEIPSTLSDYNQFNSIPYPKIHFGYASPGDYFIAKHNWWAFEMSLAAPKSGVTGVADVKRRYCLSVYEVPSQLAISAAGFAKVGEFSDGSAWGNINVAGNIYADDLEVAAGTYDGISSRKGIDLSGGGVTGLDSKYESDYGREQYEVDTNGELLPISLSSNSGRVAFVPVVPVDSSGQPTAEFYDLFLDDAQGHNVADYVNSSSVLGSSKWAEYSRGAAQCEMRVIVTRMNSTANQTPTEIAFYYTNSSGQLMGPIYYAPGGGSGVQDWPNDDEDFPFAVDSLESGESSALIVYVDRLPDFLEDEFGADVEYNRSLLVNVDYVGGVDVLQPAANPVDGQMVTVIRDAEDMKDFEKGFSLVTNLRLYIASDVNQEELATLPAGYSGTYYPPVSIFAPEIRYGSDTTDRRVVIQDGRVGSLGGGSGGPLDIKQSDGTISADEISANLKPIGHPADVPPISIMNWLIVAETIAD